jgi:anti-anti-sigma factor
MSDLTVNSARNGEVTVVTIAGRVDSVTAASLDSELDKVVRENSKLVLDLNDVEYLSSAGVRSIIRVSQSAKKSGGGVKLAAIPAQVLEVLENVGVTHMMQSYPSVDAAATSF